MIKCPKCKKDLKATIPGDSATDTQDFELTCPDGHLFFVRIEEKDLIDEND
ncbi:hypothetical protein ES703_123964 [subsurface metagenome]